MNQSSKVCSSCGKSLPVSKFNKCNSHNDGLASMCKTCCSEYGMVYRRSIRGLIIKMYNHQCESATKRKMDQPTYTKDELYNWVTGNVKFKELYDNWVASNYNTKLTPSIDRLDDYRSYSFDNIQLITWEENNKKVHVDMIEGRNNKKSRAVIQLNTDGSIVNQHYSMSQAARVTGVNRYSIVKCCKGRFNTAGGFKWKYKNVGSDSSSEV